MTRTLLAIAVVLTACADLSSPAVETDPRACPHSAGEWSQSGCARIVVVLTRPDGTPAREVRLSMRLAAPSASFPIIYALPTDANGETRIHVDWEASSFPLESAIFVAATRLDPGTSTAHLLDSLLVTARSAPAGERPQTDTLRWTLPRW